MGSTSACTDTTLSGSTSTRSRSSRTSRRGPGSQEAGRETTVLYTHPNVTDEFLPDVIRYANARGITVLCYGGLNTFNGGYSLAHPESRYRSDDPEKFHQFRYNLCPSREDVKRYFDASARRILQLGFNGLLLEESEGSGFCECASCRRAYYGSDGDSRDALHKADYELFNRLYRVIKKEKPDAIVGIRAWRMGSETGVEALRAGEKIPADAPVFWSNAMDESRFKGWVDVFGPRSDNGPGRRDTRILHPLRWPDLHVPGQYSNYVKYVDPAYAPQYPQSLPNDVEQYQLAAECTVAVESPATPSTGMDGNWPRSVWLNSGGIQRACLSTSSQWIRGTSSASTETTVARAIRSLPIVLEDEDMRGFEDDIEGRPGERRSRRTHFAAGPDSLRAGRRRAPGARGRHEDGGGLLGSAKTRKRATACESRTG